MANKKLNLGCGLDYKKGWVNVDVIDVKADMKFDLNNFPYPFKKDTFDEILLRMILEHLEEPIEVLKEVIRISKNNAKLIIIVPHANSYANLTDIQHKTNFTEDSFDIYLLNEYGLNSLFLGKKEFIFHHQWKKYMPFKSYLKIFLNGLYDDLCFEFRVRK
ncbi:MAG: class I SAM-dependent methyltransferase [Nanoarchaeota archaeon]|nr:class I SAM-dependent methyltransferase [Nanoarchaeota archaeon]